MIFPEEQVKFNSERRKESSDNSSSIRTNKASVPLMESSILAKTFSTLSIETDKEFLEMWFIFHGGCFTQSTLISLALLIIGTAASPCRGGNWTTRQPLSISSKWGQPTISSEIESSGGESGVENSFLAVMSELNGHVQPGRTLLLESNVDNTRKLNLLLWEKNVMPNTGNYLSKTLIAATIFIINFAQALSQQHDRDTVFAAAVAAATAVAVTQKERRTKDLKRSQCRGPRKEWKWARGSGLQRVRASRDKQGGTEGRKGGRRGTCIRLTCSNMLCQ